MLFEKINTLNVIVSRSEDPGAPPRPGVFLFGAEDHGHGRERGRTRLCWAEKEAGDGSLPAEREEAQPAAPPRRREQRRSSQEQVGETFPENIYTSLQKSPHGERQTPACFV